ncbi:16S rRNA (cytidine(1402)-2'-O)-methyltransferase [Candidatus Parcubacteria bacterium]|nr:16S rRNA (cytidine(1402)-2'-O)-methyltransferase [Patescibacteria group bacterium]MBU4308998.1 16S rRNA (cytidine(1402)-2'-O)-methyltransferase [Patescibacteria group bacterium]MBU4432408.1 16S rRNA (cytidine(1402)-2'-O)-methyltransferase [Patescibacteria group bacterium]MBU4577358.1 16S rRNA (cytidine(1402)-2'-O)-methyltransferase [Patescibacteria group bacterium]MCG2697046.1 16S rRNA (cytidine(1402)-2'-O)-methyltransferase [Candidatus Parcubacteria bacterium]
MNTLYIVGTPIGNLEDISMRALRILGEVDFVLCEDTRVTGVLLHRYDIKTKMISYHQHSDENKNKQILKLLADGKNLALVTDAGTPGISDPGGRLVQDVIEKFGSDDGVKIESVPGPSAVTAALSISGIATDKFIFLGFLPHKKGRQTFLDRIPETHDPIVIYESKHRIIKLLQELIEVNKKSEEYNLKLEEMDPYQKKKQGLERKRQVTSVVVCRELSKMHETVYRGDLETIIKRIEENKDDQKGEFVVIIA